MNFLCSSQPSLVLGRQGALSEEVLVEGVCKAPPGSRRRQQGSSRDISAGRYGHTALGEASWCALSSRIERHIQSRISVWVRRTVDTYISVRVRRTSDSQRRVCGTLMETRTSRHSRNRRRGSILRQKTLSSKPSPDLHQLEADRLFVATEIYCDEFTIPVVCGAPDELALVGIVTTV